MQAAEVLSINYGAQTAEWNANLNNSYRQQRRRHRNDDDEDDALPKGISQELLIN